jgi:hypothetical protein
MNRSNPIWDEVNNKLERTCRNRPIPHLFRAVVAVAAGLQPEVRHAFLAEEEPPALPPGAARPAPCLSELPVPPRSRSCARLPSTLARGADTLLPASLGPLNRWSVTRRTQSVKGRFVKSTAGENSHFDREHPTIRSPAPHSITSSARASSIGGTSRPGALPAMDVAMRVLSSSRAMISRSTMQIPKEMRIPESGRRQGHRGQQLEGRRPDCQVQGSCRTRLAEERNPQRMSGRRRCEWSAGDTAWAVCKRICPVHLPKDARHGGVPAVRGTSRQDGMLLTYLRHSKGEQLCLHCSFPCCGSAAPWCYSAAAITSSRPCTSRRNVFAAAMRPDRNVGPHCFFAAHAGTKFSITGSLHVRTIQRRTQQ